MLKHLAQTLRQNSRLADIVGRLGGEEFGLLLVHTSASEGINFAERLRSLIEQDLIALDTTSVAITVSIGLATLTTDISDLDSFLKQADQALYQAKNSGRNQVVEWQSPHA